MVQPPNYRKLSITGEEKEHAEEAKDSAAFMMINELVKNGLCQKR